MNEGNDIVLMKEIFADSILGRVLKIDSTANDDGKEYNLDGNKLIV